MVSRTPYSKVVLEQAVMLVPMLIFVRACPTWPQWDFCAERRASHSTLVPMSGAGDGNKFRVENPFDGLSADSYKKYIGDIQDKGAGKMLGSYTYTDHLLGVDMGGPNGPGFPAAPPATRTKRIEEFEQRRKGSYSLMVGDGNIGDRTMRDVLRTTAMAPLMPGAGAQVPCFQNGRATYVFLETQYDRAPIHSERRELNKQWDNTTMASTVGVQEDSVGRYALMLQRLNGLRPAGFRKSNDEIAEKILEGIADQSKHFSEGATDELNSTPGLDRRFEHVAGHPLAGQRDLHGIVNHYDVQWRSAVRSKIIDRVRAAGAAATERGMGGFEDLSILDDALIGQRTVVVPQRTLYRLQEAGYDLMRGTTTTSDFETVSVDDLADALAGERFCGHTEQWVNYRG